VPARRCHLPAPQIALLHPASSPQSAGPSSAARGWSRSSRFPGDESYPSPNTLNFLSPSLIINNISSITQVYPFFSSLFSQPPPSLRRSIVASPPGRRPSEASLAQRISPAQSSRPPKEYLKIKRLSFTYQRQTVDIGCIPHFFLFIPLTPGRVAQRREHRPSGP